MYGAMIRPAGGAGTMFRPGSRPRMRAPLSSSDRMSIVDTPLLPMSLRSARDDNLTFGEREVVDAFGREHVQRAERFAVAHVDRQRDAEPDATTREPVACTFAGSEGDACDEQTRGGRAVVDVDGRTRAPGRFGHAPSVQDDFPGDQLLRARGA